MVKSLPFTAETASSAAARTSPDKRSFSMDGKANSTRPSRAFIESDRVEGTVVYNPDGHRMGSIKRLIIEKVSGISYADYIKKNIFTPLGMMHSTVLNLSENIYQQAIGYEWDSATSQFRKADAAESVFFTTEGDGGIYTSVDDYMKWFQGLQQSRILSAPTVQQARSIQFEIDSTKNLGYGYGWFIGAKERPEVVYHTGSNGGFRSIVFTIPSRNYVMVIFSNRTGIDLEQLAVEINKILRVENKSFARVESLVSFQECWPIFAPCKKIRSFLISFAKSWTGNAMALN